MSNFYGDVKHGDALTPGWVQNVEDGLGSGKPAQGASYVIFKDGSEYEARNGTTGEIDYARESVSNCINAVIADSDTTTGASILVKQGIHVPDSPINIDRPIHLMGEGMHNTRLVFADDVNDNMIDISGGASAFYFPIISDIHLRGNPTNQTQGHGINVAANTADAQIRNVFVDYFKENGIKVLTGWGARIDRCVIEYNGLHGIQIQGSQWSISRCFSAYNTRIGIYTPSSITARGIVSNNELYLNGRSGVWIEDGNYCIVTGNSFRANSYGNANTYSQLYLEQDPDYTMITSNTFNGDYDGTDYPKYGVDINGGTHNIVMVNSFVNHVTAPVRDNGSNNIIRHNDGYVTENSGTATVANGNTSVAVTHNLSYTPTLQDISVAPTNTMGNATKFYISDPTSTDFDIHVDADPGATTATFVWAVRKV